MKKQSFRKRSTLAPSALVAGAVLGVVVLLTFVRLVFPDLFFSVTAPLWGIGTGITDGFHTSFAGFSRTSDLIRERDQLVAENNSLQSQIRTLESDRLIAQELYGTSTTPHGILADVVARPPFSPYDSLVINRGTNDRIQNGAMVTADGGVPIGVITTVSETSARVSLFSSARTETAAWTGPKQVPVTLVGEGAGAFSATLPKDASVEVGNEIFVASSRAPLGTLERIDTNPSSPTQSLRVKSFVNPFSIRQVLVLEVRSL